MDPIAKHITFSGRVQGVGFRFTAHRMARRHDLIGFVRNLPNGTVEMLAQGAAKDIDACLADIREYFGGYLRDTQIADTPHDPHLTDFRITF
jgi:acylphosphatase